MSDTQSFARMLHENWSEITGWGLILSGLSLATWALGERGTRKHAEAAVPNAAPRMLPTRTTDAPRRLDPAGEWRILMGIAERGFLCIEMLADMQDRAREEVEAADEALSRLIADCAAVLMPAGRAPTYEDQPGEFAAPVPASTARPLAA